MFGQGNTHMIGPAVRKALLLFTALRLFFLPVFLSAAEEKEDFQAENLPLGIPLETDQILNRKGFSLGYSYRHRQALWVGYVLRKEHLTGRKFRRPAVFKTDPAVKRTPVSTQEYNNTGLDRGHLAPAGDMAYSAEAIANSFFLSNISPQVPACNRGIWKRLESQVRKWALREGALCIFTGPIFTSEKREQTADASETLPLPGAFYKVILDMTPPMKMIGFIVPNRGSRERLPKFAVPVDEVEQRTGCAFYDRLEDELEERLESAADFVCWFVPAGQTGPPRSAESVAPDAKVLEKPRRTE